MNQLLKKGTIIGIFLFATLLVQAQWGGWGSGMRGEGPIVKKTLKVDKFRGFSLGVPANVYLSKGKQNVEIKGQKNIIANIETDVRKGYWKIEFDRNVRKMKDLEIYISLPSFDRLAIAGSGSIVGEDTFNNLSDLKVSISGSGDIELEGAVEDLEVSIAGSGDVNLKDLKADNCDISIAGSGDCEIHVSEDLKVSIAGSGDVKYKGNPNKVKSSIAGSGDVRSFD